MSDDDDSGKDNDGEEEPRSEIMARRPRMVLIKLKKGEKVIEFWSSFFEHMLDWDIKLESVLARQYFESTIVDRYEVRNTNAGIKRRHPHWNLDAQVL